MRIFLIVILFFVLGALLIIANGDLALVESGNFETFSKLYLGWLDGIYDNLKTLTGNAAESSWLPETG
jgi:hypothetical protein